MVSTANTASSTAKLPFRMKVSPATITAQAAGQSSQPVVVATSNARITAATASQIQNGWAT